MFRRVKLRSLLIGLALLALVGLLSSNAGQEAASALAESPQAQVEVTLEITNTADPSMLGAPEYEISSIIFTKNFFPPASIPPGQMRIFGPFTLSEAPNDLTLKGRKGPPGPIKEPFSFTIFPFISDTPYQIVAIAQPPPPPPERKQNLVEYAAVVRKAVKEFKIPRYWPVVIQVSETAATPDEGGFITIVENDYVGFYTGVVNGRPIQGKFRWGDGRTDTIISLMGGRIVLREVDGKRCFLALDTTRYWAEAHYVMYTHDFRPPM